MNRIYLRKAIKLYNYSAFLSFDFEPAIVEHLDKNFPEKFWHKKLKMWEIPITEYRRFKEPFPCFAVINEIDKIDETPKTTQLLAIPSDFKFKTKPYGHQLQTVQESQNRFKFLLSDGPGCGKTKQIIDIARLHKHNRIINRCLIVCGINNSKWNWVREIKQHSNEGYVLLGERFRKNGNSYEGGNSERLDDIKNLKDELFVITNIQSLREPSIVRALQQAGFGMIALDESHKCNNPQADQTKGLLKLDSKIKIPMTGTAILNKPLDLYIVLRWLGEESHSFGAFKNHYCTMGGFGGYQITGYKNMGELRSRVEKIQIRRVLEEVKDVPETIWKPQLIDMSPEQWAIYNDVKNGIIEKVEKVIENPNPLTEFIRLRQATSYPPILAETEMGAKFERILDIMEDAVESGRKVLIYSNWTEVILPLKRVLAKFNPAFIVGGMGKGIEQEKLKLSQNESCGCMVGTIGAMGTSHNLPAASWVVFIDQPWTYGDMKQAIDRTRRLEGTEHKTVVYPLWCRNTVDEKIAEILEEKKGYADFLIDGKVELLNRRKLINFLLS